jgi:hypothetical protein
MCQNYNEPLASARQVVVSVAFVKGTPMTNGGGDPRDRRPT